jgi:glycosyltransferase involved in cell wall biosynthesis
VRRRVLHIIPFLWSGAGRVLTTLCEHQRRMAEVHLATTGRRGELRDWPLYRRRLRRAGVVWHRLDTFGREAQVFWATVARATALVDALAPDVIHAHAGVPAVVAALAAARARRRVSVVAQMYSWGPDRPAWMDEMDLWGFARARRVICSAAAYERRLLAGGVARARLVRVPWGIDLAEAERVWRRRAGRAAGRRGQATSATASRLTMGFVGRLEPRKGQLELVRAFALVRQARPEARLALVGPDGDAAYAAEVRRTIRTLGLDTAVDLPGQVRSVWPHLAALDLFVSLSADEGQGLAVLEAMAAGVPVVALRAAGIEDYFDARYGTRLERRDPASVARAILDALGAPGRLAACARRAHAMVSRRYGWEATVQAIAAAYGWQERKPRQDRTRRPARMARAGANRRAGDWMGP